MLLLLMNRRDAIGSERRARKTEQEHEQDKENESRRRGFNRWVGNLVIFAACALPDVPQFLGEGGCETPQYGVFFTEIAVERRGGIR